MLFVFKVLKQNKKNIKHEYKVNIINNDKNKFKMRIKYYWYLANIIS